jgi:signal peptidase I
MKKSSKAIRSFAPPTLAKPFKTPEESPETLKNKTRDNKTKPKGDKNPGKNPDKNSKSKGKDKVAVAVTWQSQLWDYGKAVILAIILALIIRSFVVQAFHIPSGSMIPTFLVGDRVLVSKFSYGVRNPFNNKVLFETGSPERWDVVIFKFPENPSVDFVKRVVGLPGESVEVKKGAIFINGEEIQDPHGHYDRSEFFIYRDFGPMTVPEGQYFMMGDNRDFSNDSRSWGFVDKSLLRGKAWRLYWSWDSETRDIAFWKRLRVGRLLLRIQ